MDLADIQHQLQQLNGIAQSHITVEELEIVVTACLDITTQQAAADIADSVHLEQVTPHASLLTHIRLLQHAHHININARAMT